MLYALFKDQAGIFYNELYRSCQLTTSSNLSVIICYTNTKNPDRSQANCFVLLHHKGLSHSQL